MVGFERTEELELEVTTSEEDIVDYNRINLILKEVEKVFEAKERQEINAFAKSSARSKPLSTQSVAVIPKPLKRSTLDLSEVDENGNWIVEDFQDERPQVQECFIVSSSSLFPRIEDQIVVFAKDSFEAFTIFLKNLLCFKYELKLMAIFLITFYIFVVFIPSIFACQQVYNEHLAKNYRTYVGEATVGFSADLFQWTQQNLVFVFGDKIPIYKELSQTRKAFKWITQVIFGKERAWVNYIFNM